MAFFSNLISGGNPLDSFFTTKPGQSPYSGGYMDPFSGITQVFNTAASQPGQVASSLSSGYSSGMSSLSGAISSGIGTVGDTVKGVSQNVTDVFANLTNILPYILIAGGVVLVILLLKK